MSDVNSTTAAMPIPIKIRLLQKARVLELAFSDGSHYALPCEYLRVFSPSAEVRGHGSVALPFVTGKQAVNIIGIDPVGNYAVKLIFDDGHATGIYSWAVLYDLACHYPENWQRYQREVGMAK